MRKFKRYLPAILIFVGLVLGGCAWLLRPLEAKLTANPTSGPAPLSVTFSAAGSTGPIVSFTLDFGDGSSPYSGTDITVNISHTYDTPGTYTAVLTVQDAQGRTDTDSVTINVLPGTTASLSASPTNPTAGDDVTFILQATAASGRELVSWKLWYAYTEGASPDEQGTISGTTFYLTLTHQYSDPGTYTVRFEVKDSADQVVVKTLEITVASPPPTIDEFKASGDGGTTWVSYKDANPILSVASGTTVTFAFQATPATGRKLTKWTLSTPGTDPTSQTQTGNWNSLNITGLERVYTNTSSQTQSYTATLQVWDDLNNSAQATITIEVAPAPAP